MSNEATTAIAVEGDTSVSITPAAPAKSDPTPKNDDVSMPKAAFEARLEQAQRSVLKALGIESIDAAKAALATAKAAEDAKKSDAQKLAEYEGQLTSKSASVDALTKTVAAFAQSQMASLTDGQKAAVMSIAGDDPSKQLSTLEAMKPTWTLPAPATVAAPVITNSGPPPKSAPSDQGIPRSAAIDHKAVHAELRVANPVLAARYAVRHGIFNATN